jgi:hypothetical protein
MGPCLPSSLQAGSSVRYPTFDHGRLEASRNNPQRSPVMMVASVWSLPAGAPERPIGPSSDLRRMCVTQPVWAIDDAGALAPGSLIRGLRRSQLILCKFTVREMRQRLVAQPSLRPVMVRFRSRAPAAPVSDKLFATDVVDAEGPASVTRAQQCILRSLVAND